MELIDLTQNIWKLFENRVVSNSVKMTSVDQDERTDVLLTSSDPTPNSKTDRNTK